MITNPYLRKIHKESGRREITSTMVAQADEKTMLDERLKPLYHYPDLAYWRCPSCGRILSWEQISSCQPDLYCRCQMPKFMVIMQPWGNESGLKVIDAKE